MIRGQKGFSPVAIPIATVILILVAFATWTVFKNNNNVKESTSNSSSQVSPQKNLTNNSATVSPATQSISIPQWGVEASYSGNLTLSYTMNSNNSTATFSSDQLSTLSSNCMGRGGVIKRWASTDKVTNGIPADTNTPTAEAYFASADPTTYAHIGNYYYRFTHDQAACGDPSVTSNLYSQTNDTVKSLISNLKSSTN